MSITDFSAGRMEQDRARLLELLEERSVKNGKVVLSSGKESDFYVDCKRTSLTAEGHLLIGRVFLSRVPEDVVAVGGLTLGADPLASAVSTISSVVGRPVDAFIVRKEPKVHGTEQWIERGELAPGAKVVVVEDVITTGASSLRAIERIRSAGFEPVKLIALVDREEGGREAIEASGVPVDAVFARSDFIPEKT